MPLQRNIAPWAIIPPPFAHSSQMPPPFRQGRLLGTIEKVLCQKAEDKKIPVVPPQFTACAASGIPIDPQSCIGLTRPGLLDFQPGRSERNSAPSFFLPCTHRQFSGKRELARTGFHQRVCLVKLQTSLPLLVFQVKNIWGFCLNKREKFGISMEENGVFVEKRWKIMDETYGKKWQILLN